jgi:hypothetical protein
MACSDLVAHWQSNVRLKLGSLETLLDGSFGGLTKLYTEMRLANGCAYESLADAFDAFRRFAGV